MSGFPMGGGRLNPSPCTDEDWEQFAQEVADTLNDGGAGADEKFAAINGAAAGYWSEVVAGEGLFDGDAHQIVGWYRDGSTVHLFTAQGGGGATYTAGCGIDITDDVISVDKADLAGPGLQASSTGCSVEVKYGNGLTISSGFLVLLLGCGLEFDAGAVKAKLDPAGFIDCGASGLAVDQISLAAALADGETIIATSGVLSAVGEGGAYTAGCGITIVGTTISVDNADLAGEGLRTAETGCALEVQYGSGLTIDDGDLIVQAGCGLELVEGEVVAKLDPAGYIECSEDGLAVDRVELADDLADGETIIATAGVLRAIDSATADTLTTVYIDHDIPRAVQAGSSFQPGLATVEMYEYNSTNGRYERGEEIEIENHDSSSGLTVNTGQPYRGFCTKNEYGRYVLHVVLCQPISTS